MNKRKEIIDWIVSIIIAIVLALIVRYYLGTPTIVKSVSMKPTLVENQRLILNRVARTVKKMPNRGDIITFEAPLKTYTVNQDDLIAKYSNATLNWFEYFKYYILEIGKESYIKRVIALPGEHVKIDEGKIYINGEELKEEYLQEGIITTVDKDIEYNDFIVPDNSVFVLGDNRAQSTDSRKFGCIPLNKIEGKVLIRFWPLNVFGKVK